MAGFVPRISERVLPLHLQGQSVRDNLCSSGGGSVESGETAVEVASLVSTCMEIPTSFDYAGHLWAFIAVVHVSSGNSEWARWCVMCISSLWFFWYLCRQSESETNLQRCVETWGGRSLR